MPATGDTSQSLRKEIGVLEKCNSEFIVVRLTRFIQLPAMSSVFRVYCATRCCAVLLAVVPCRLGQLPDCLQLCVALPNMTSVSWLLLVLQGYKGTYNRDGHVWIVME